MLQTLFMSLSPELGTSRDGGEAPPPLKAQSAFSRARVKVVMETMEAGGSGAALGRAVKDRVLRFSGLHVTYQQGNLKWVMLKSP